ncbi:hypothetical protein BASA81_002586 [Batrachochytrium salamandrivorans]|nr:hypothetical protein BASA81_002586 [Batrachochytrium salamandrivorans]
MNESVLFAPFADKMRQAGLDLASIQAFRSNFAKLVAGDTGLMPESSIDPVLALPTYSELDKPSSKLLPALYNQTCVLKLNGGLGTSMGLEKAKSLLEIKGGETFLSLSCKQIQRARKSHPECTSIQFMLMNSFSTSSDTLLAMQGLESDFIELMQNKSPKVSADGKFTPAVCLADEELEWCPPGHGDLFAALLGSGILDRLVDVEKCRYLFVSNSDNLGATLDPTLLHYFTSSGKALLMEVAERTEADKKGGHLALVKGTQGFTLRESAMCPPADLPYFQNITTHKFFNTNNIWLDLVQVRQVMRKHGGIMPLPLIRNCKTVDPRNPKSQPVYQLETAMGAAIEAFGQAGGAVVVPRSRFAPVKTCSDLFALRSDAYGLTEDFQIVLLAKTNPIVVLDDAYFKLVDGMEARVKVYPSLLECEKLVVNGPAVFDQPNVKFSGKVTITIQGKDSKSVPSQSMVNGTELVI